jgi:predicted nuclease of predicted toxin-antitoxin system
MKLLIDMNLTPRWVDVLRQAGIDAVHWSARGAMNAPDSEIMRIAAAENYVVFTHDLDFSAILAATEGKKPSVIHVRGNDIRPEAISEIVIKALHQVAADLEAGALLTIDTKRVRLRILPLSL